MPFVAAAVAGYLGLGALGTAALEIAASIGLSFAAQAIGGGQQQPQAPGGTSLSLRTAADASRTVIFGKTAVPGSLVYWNLYGTSNETLQLVIDLADHECDGLDSVYINGYPFTVNNDGTVTPNAEAAASQNASYTAGSTGTVPAYPDMRVTFYSGAPGQAADAELVAQSGGRWTSTSIGANVAYAYVRMTYSEAGYPRGIPQFRFVVRGAKLYDQRKDSTAGGSGAHRLATPSTWTYTDNPAVCAHALLRGMDIGGQHLIGMFVAPAAIRSADFFAAANACDEVMTRLDGSTEPRYRVGLELQVKGQQNRSHLERLTAAMAGTIVEFGGVYRILAGVTQGVVAALSDDDLIVGETFAATPKLPRSQLVNSVFGSFPDPAHAYDSVGLPPRTSSTDEATDGGIRLPQIIDLAGVTSRTQAQRVLEIARKRARRMLTVSGRLRPRWCVLEPGDWITLTSARRGYTAKTFDVLSVKTNADLSSDVVLREVDDAIDDWTPATDELADASVVDLAPAGPKLLDISGFALANVIVAATGGVQRPGLNATWTPVTDPTAIGVTIEYRKQGDTVALERRVLSPAAGTYTWVDGVQGGLIYEARAILETRPARATTWTSWHAPVAATDVQVVARAAVADSVLNGATLSAQEAFELKLASDADAVFGSGNERLAAVQDMLNRAGDQALAGLIAARKAQDGVTTEVVARKDLAQTVTTVQTTVAGHTASITSQQSSINGMAARWAIVIDINGNIVGSVRLDGTASGSNFTVTADTFNVALPGVSGGAAVPVFAIANVGGVPKLALRGDMIVDGAITAQKLNVASLSSIVADVGTVTAGVLKSSDNKFIIDLNAKTLTITT